MGILVNLKKFINTKKDKIKPEHKIKSKIKKYILDPEYGSTKFIDLFFTLSVQNNWSWRGRFITKDMIIDQLVNDSYRIIKAEIDYFLTNHIWRSENWCIAGISSGRITVRPVEFEDTNKEVWLELEYSTTL